MFKVTFDVMRHDYDESIDDDWNYNYPFGEVNKRILKTPYYHLKKPQNIIQGVTILISSMYELTRILQEIGEDEYSITDIHDNCFTIQVGNDYCD